MKLEKIVLNEERNVTLTALLQEVGGEFGSISQRPAVLVLPGGGYAMCSEREADPVALAFSQAGFQVFILRYSVGDHRTWPNPLNDYEMAIKRIRSNKDWHVDSDRVCVVGFSAGGHLAACAATLSQNRPNAALIGYGALTKEICDACQPGMPYPVDCVDEKTPPCFLFATRDDNIVNVSNTVAFQQALVEKGVSFEAHIYSYGPHGFSTGQSWLIPTPMTPRAARWTQDALDWLGEVWGCFAADGFTAPAFSRNVNADQEEMLSVRCTLGHLLRQGGCAKEILSEAMAVLEAYAHSRFPGKEMQAMAVLNGYRFQELLCELHFTPEQINAIDVQLRKIGNKKA